MLKQIPKSDIVVRPIKVYKEFTLDENDVYPLFAKSGSSGNYDAEIEEKTHGIAKIPLYASIKAQFYNNPATASVVTEVGRRKSYASTNERILEDEIAVLAIPQIKYGEGIKVGSVRLVDNGSGRTYTDDGYSNLIDSGSNIKGNIFYDRGLVVVTKDINSGSTLNTFNLSYRSTKTIYENEIFLSVLENEFNVSMNSTAINWNPTRTYGQVKPQFWEYDLSSSIDPTGSYLAPYITTIGLYDDELNMIALAKLPQPIKSLSDYPLNFIVRFDT